MVPQPGKKTIEMQILSNTLRSKSNETMKLIVYNMKNIFLKNNTQNVAEKLFPDLFLKNKNWAYLKYYTVCFYYMPG